MESLITDILKSQGVWAALFVALLAWVMKTNQKREETHQEFFLKVSEVLGKVEASLEAILTFHCKVGEKIDTHIADVDIHNRPRRRRAVGE